MHKTLSAYKRFFSVHRWIAQNIKNSSLMIAIISRIGPYFNPAPKQNSISNCGRAGHWFAEPTRWRRYLSVASIATALHYRMKDLPSILEIEWEDPDNTLIILQQQGGLLLTYHHAFAYELPSLVANNRFRIEALAISPEESPLSSLLYSEQIDKWFSDSKQHLGGGSWIFLRKNQSNDTSLRTALRALKNGDVVFSLHDFPNFYPKSKSITANILGKRISAPLGMIEPAVKTKRPITLGYITWIEKNKIKITLNSLNSNGKEQLSSEQVMERYFAQLENIIEETPEFWDGWGALRT